MTGKARSLAGVHLWSSQRALRTVLQQAAAVHSCRHGPASSGADGSGVGAGAPVSVFATDMSFTSRNL